MKALVYLRISSDRTGQEAGVDRQREDCLERCASRGYEVVSVEMDNDISATSGKRRPGFEALLAAVEAGRADAVIAWSVDRLQRSRRDEARLYEACQRQGVLLSLVKGADLDFSTAAGRFVADSLGSVARMEVEMKSERQKRANLQTAQQGRRGPGRRPFGYCDRGMTVRDDEAAAVRAAYRSLLAGVSLGEIARTWNGAGLRTGQGGEWRRDSVRHVLQNQRNTGIATYRGEVMGKAQWPAIVDESTYAAAVALLADPTRRRAHGGKALLTGLAVCGVCGATVHSGASNTAGKRSYRCSGSMGHFARKAEPIENYVVAVVIARLSRPDARDLLVKHDLPDLDALRQEAAGYRARLDALAVEFADGSLTAGQLRTATERLRANLAAVEAKTADAGRVDILGPLVTADDVTANWDALSLSRQRAVIDALMTVRIDPIGRGRGFDPETLRIEWR